MKKKISNFLLRQYNIPGVGAFVDSLYTSLPLLSIINFLSILTVLYTSVKEYMLEYTPWLTFWMFVLFLGVVTIITMVVMYKFILPAVWVFRQKQMFQHESELLDRIGILEEKIDLLLKEGNNGKSR